MFSEDACLQHGALGFRLTLVCIAVGSFLKCFPRRVFQCSCRISRIDIKEFILFITERGMAGLAFWRLLLLLRRGWVCWRVSCNCLEFWSERRVEWVLFSQRKTFNRRNFSRVCIQTWLHQEHVGSGPYFFVPSCLPPVSNFQRVENTTNPLHRQRTLRFREFSYSSFDYPNVAQLFRVRFTLIGGLRRLRCRMSRPLPKFM